ncbi:hypothetical protein niasHT_039701 [Heterodera trifolii]|uniref:Uncharacterized protein n=1 Tax=Heterodera trifolii TaxID=157864 RepID=A0ABD2IFE9_9BILA
MHLQMFFEPFGIAFTWPKCVGTVEPGLSSGEVDECMDLTCHPRPLSQKEKRTRIVYASRCRVGARVPRRFAARPVHLETDNRQGARRRHTNTLMVKEASTALITDGTKLCRCGEALI